MRKNRVVLTEAERAYLLSIVRKGEHKARTIRRAQTLLQADGQQLNDKQLSLLLHCAPPTVTLTLNRFFQMRSSQDTTRDVAQRLDEVLQERPRSGQPMKVDQRIEAQITAMACSAQGPEGRSRWTLKMMADEVVRLELAESISAETVRRVLKKAGSSPGSRSNGV